MSIIIEDMIMPKSCVACPFEHNGDCYGGKPKLIMDIEDFNYYRHPNCPLNEVEPIKYGHWIVNLTTPSGNEYKCSVCGDTTLAPGKECKHCGARMDAQIGEDKSHPFAESVMMGMDGGEE